MLPEQTLPEGVYKLLRKKVLSYFYRINKQCFLFAFFVSKMIFMGPEMSHIFCPAPARAVFAYFRECLKMLLREVWAEDFLESWFN